MVTQTDIDALNAAIASGERQVTIGSQSVSYRSISDLIMARDDLVRQLEKQNGSTRPKRVLLTYGGRDYS